MLMIPAIDIIEGECVRLTQGQFDKKKIYSKDPIQVARDFVAQGAKYLHVVDLDGARLGMPKNQKLIVEMCKDLGVPMQVGGGIRDIETIKFYLENGLDRVILGTKAIKDENFLKEVLQKFGVEKIVVALDVKNGKLSLSGWVENVSEDLKFYLLKLKMFGVKWVMVTDVVKDGTLEKPNFGLMNQVKAYGFDLIAAGGVSKKEDVFDLFKTAEAVVAGKSLYEGKLNLCEVLAPSTLAKRIIPCLDVKNGRVVKGINFENLLDSGDPVELAKKYAADGADELVFLDITASKEKRQTMIELVEKVAEEIFIPFTVGGGVKNLADISDLLRAGADKVAINTVAVTRPKLITKAARKFGSQCVVVAIDVKKVGNKWKVFIRGGSEETSLEAIECAREAERLGAGEILLTSMDRDGTGSGFDLELLRSVSEKLKIPVIASGGAGKLDDFKDAFLVGKADAVLAASLFHFGQLSIPELKKFIKFSNINVRL